ncbi:hypothetical protein [Fusobacterium sp. THCT1E2]
MNKKIFIKRVLIPSTILFILAIMISFFKNGTFVDEIHPYILLYLLILFAVFSFGAFLELAQRVTGDLMEGSWSKRIIFIIVALVMIYLYKSTGRI